MGIGGKFFATAACGLFFSVSSAYANNINCQNQHQQQQCQAAISDQKVGQTTTTASQAGLVSVQTNITTIRDFIQAGGTAAASTPLGFAASGGGEWDARSPDLLSYAAKQQSAGDAFARAVATPTGSTVKYSAWGQGLFDYERRGGHLGIFDIGRTTRTVGGLGGFDAIITRVRTSSDALVLGFFSGDTSSHTDARSGAVTKVQGPQAGVYAAYVDGGLSADATFKTDFFDMDQSKPGAIVQNLGMNNYSYAMNFNNKIWLTSVWWVEETVGTLIVRSVWDSASKAQSFVDGRETRIQGGVRTGTSFKWNQVEVQPTFTGILYTPLLVHAAMAVPVPGAPIAPTDEGRIFGQAIGKLNVVWASYFSS